jgi:hypothetical protein
MVEAGKFKNGAFYPDDPVPEQRRQLIEISHSLHPFKASIKLNGKPIRCKSYTFYQAAREFGTLTLELPVTDIELTSDSGIMYVEIDGMRFKRVE